MAKSKSSARTAEVEAAAIAVPYASKWPEAEYVSDRVILRLTASQAATLHAIWHGLKNAGEKLADGAVIEERSQAVQWILEQVLEESGK